MFLFSLGGISAGSFFADSLAVFLTGEGGRPPPQQERGRCVNGGGDLLLRLVSIIAREAPHHNNERRILLPRNEVGGRKGGRGKHKQGNLGFYLRSFSAPPLSQRRGVLLV